MVAAHGLRSCVSWALEHMLKSCGTGHRGLVAQQRVGNPGSGIEPLSPTLVGGFFTHEPSRYQILTKIINRFYL